MKNPLVLILSLCFFGLCSIANAIPIFQLPDSGVVQIPGFGEDIAKNGTGIGGGNANNQANNLFRLTTVLSNINPSAPLPTPILDGGVNLGSNVVSTGGLIGFDYAVLHYGSGPNGTSGGGVELFFLNGESEFTFPSIGTGPNGFGGFSSLTLFKGENRNGSVPDGGSTLMLFGTALGLIAAARRRFRV
jgi:hypothetical protein